MSKTKHLLAAIFGIYVALILWVTILGREVLLGTPIVYKPFHVFLSFWRNIQRGGLTGNFLGNIILFIPNGFLLPVVTGWRKWYKIITVGFGFSLLIEISQYVTHRGCFDPDDIILNSIGTVVGLCLWEIIHKITTVTDK